MSQQGLSIVDLGAEVVDMGDLEYIEGKVVAGDYFQVSGVLGTTIEFIVPNNQTAFMIEAKITMNTNPTIAMPAASGNNSTNNQIVADFKIGGVTKSKAKIGTQAGARNLASGTSSSQGAGIAPFGESKFNVLGLSLVGNGVNEAANKITIEIDVNNGDGYGEFSGYLSTT